VSFLGIAWESATAGTAVGMEATAYTKGNTPCSPRTGGAGWGRRGGKGRDSAVRVTAGPSEADSLPAQSRPPCHRDPLDKIICAINAIV